MDTLAHYACPHCHGRGVTYRPKKKIPDKRKGTKFPYAKSTTEEPQQQQLLSSTTTTVNLSSSSSLSFSSIPTTKVQSIDSPPTNTDVIGVRKRTLDPDGLATDDTTATVSTSLTTSTSSSSSSTVVDVTVPVVRTLISDPCTVCAGNGVVPVTYFDKQGSIASFPSSLHNASSISSSSVLPSSSNQHPPNHSSSSLLRLHDKYTDASTPLIVISGCGIAGAAIGLALLQRGFRVRIFERDNAFAARKQGYGLTMQQGSLVLATLGLTQIEGISSMAHYSFNPHGELVGCYGRNLYRRNTNNNDNNNNTTEKRIRTETKDENNNSSSSSSSNSINNPSLVFSSSSSVPYTGGKHSGNGIASNHKERHNIHLPRQRLRRILMDALPVATVQWGISIEKYSSVGGVGLSKDTTTNDTGSSSSILPVDNPNIMVHLSDGRIQPATLLIGSDGIHSPLRKLKIQDKMNYLNLMVILGFTTCNHPLACRRIFQTTDGDTRLYTMPFTGQHQQYIDKESYLPLLHSSPPLSVLVNDDKNPRISHSTPTTTTLSFPNTHSSTITLHPYDINDEYNKDTLDRTMWQLSFHINENEAKELAMQGSEALKKEALRRCQHWHNPIPALLASTPANIISGYPAYDRDIPSMELLRYGPIDPITNQPIDPVAHYVVLIGDSMHPMSPFKGQGANQALVDAVTLAQAIYDSDIGWIRMRQGTYIPSSRYASPPSLLQAISDFEVSMVKRAGPKVLESRANAAYLHSTAALTKANCTRAHAALAAVQNLDNELQERIAHSSGALTDEEYRLAEEEVRIFLRIPVQ